MPIKTNFLERTLFYTLNQGPAPILDIFAAIGFRTICAAIRLGVVDALDKSPGTFHETAAACSIDPQGARRLLDILVKFSYARQQGDRYELSSLAKKWLTDRDGTNFSPYFLFWDAVLREFFHNLEDTIRSGAPERNLYEWLENQPEVSRHFQEAMIAIASVIKAEVAAKLKFLNTAGSILDVGGGHAEYSVALCQQYPDLRATVFDSLGALKAGRLNIGGAGLADRIQTRPGSFLTDDLPAGFDAALVFNIIHGFKPGQNIDLFRKVRQALEPGGRIVVLEQVDENTPLPLNNTAVKILDLTYFHTLGGQVYSYAAIEHWLYEAGYKTVERLDMIKVPGNALVVGTK
jgi:SAM-dependent methyltransferase